MQNKNPAESTGRDERHTDAVEERQGANEGPGEHFGSTGQDERGHQSNQDEW